jgi:hypothetical protein
MKFKDGQQSLSQWHGKWEARSFARYNLTLSYLHNDLHRRSLRRKPAVSGDSTGMRWQAALRFAHATNIAGEAFSPHS